MLESGLIVGNYRVIRLLGKGGMVCVYLVKHLTLGVEYAMKVLKDDAAAAQGMVHRDIKPANIMFDADGRVRVADLGIAKRRGDDETTMTRDDAVFGTPAYMSPEQARDTGKVDVRSDIYSLGMVFWHVLAGARPYADSTAMAIFMSVLDKRPLPDVRERNPAVHQEVAELVKDMCAKDVNRRVQSPQELIRRIDASVAQAPLPRRQLVAWWRVVQRAHVQHGAARAPQPRGEDARPDGREARRAARHHPRVKRMERIEARDLVLLTFVTRRRCFVV